MNKRRSNSYGAKASNFASKFNKHHTIIVIKVKLLQLDLTKKNIFNQRKVKHLNRTVVCTQYPHTQINKQLKSIESFLARVYGSIYFKHKHSTVQFYSFLI